MSALSFAHPLIALGALGVAAPIIIHFFFRRRARELRFSAMRFVLLSYKKVARKLLLHEYLLLLTRCLLVATLALALAVPLFARKLQGMSRGERPLAMILIVDTSISMTRKQGGDSLLELAQRQAREWQERLVKGDRVGVMDGARLTGTGLTTDPAETREFIKSLKPFYAPARLTEAVALASSQLADFQESDRAIVIFSDLQRSGFIRTIETRAETPPIYLVDLAAGLTPQNLSIRDLEVNLKSLAREETIEIAARLMNSGERAFKRSLLKLEFGGQTAAQGFVDLLPGQSVDKTFTLTSVPPGPGRLLIAVEDGMTADNAHHFLVKGGEQVRALVVDGAPGVHRLESETYFLDQALNPRLYARSRISPRTITEPELAKANLEDFQVLVLANAGRIKPETAGRIKEFVKNGGGLLITLGDQVDADAYNELFGDLLPRELRGVKLSYAGAQAEGDVRVMRLETPAASGELHPILSIFSDPSQGDLGLAGFWKFFLMQQELTPKSQVILRLTDGVPIMVEKPYGRGKVIIFASSVDRTWNDFCIHPTYLPLFQQTVQYLGDALLSKDPGQLRAGQAIELPIGSDVTGAAVKGPDGVVRKADLIEEKGARRIRILNTELPGVYAVKFRFADEPASELDFERPDRSLVLNVDPAESDLTRISVEEIRALTRAKSVTLVGGDDPEEADENEITVKKSFARWLIWLLAGLAVLERALVRKG